MSFAASDPGHVCPTCGGAISWLDHLPPLYADEPVRCYVLRPPALRLAPVFDRRTAREKAVDASPAMQELRLVQDESRDLK